MTYALLYIIIGALLWHFFKRQILTLATWTVLLCVLALFVRAAPSLGLSSGWLGTFYGAIGAGLVVSLLTLRVIDIRYLINSDRRRAHDRVDQEHDKRMPGI